MSNVRLLIEQIRYQVLLFVRVPVAVFFTLIFPLIMLVLFNALFGGDDATVATPTGEWSLQQFYVGALAAFTAVSGTFTNLAITVPERRQNGVMKRWRGTPLPRWVYLGGFVGSAMAIALGGALIMIVVGVTFYGLEIDAAKLPAAAVAFLLGAAVFAALGIAVSGLVRGMQTAPAVANAIVLPMAFISNTFIPLESSSTPAWMDVLGKVLPLRPFVESMQAAFNPTVDAPGFHGGNLGRLVLWGAAGLIVAIRYFKWEPVAEDGVTSRRRGRVRDSQPT